MMSLKEKKKKMRVGACVEVAATRAAAGAKPSVIFSDNSHLSFPFLLVEGHSLRNKKCNV